MKGIWLALSAVIFLIGLMTLNWWLYAASIPGVVYGYVSYYANPPKESA